MDLCGFVRILTNLYRFAQISYGFAIILDESGHYGADMTEFLMNLDPLVQICQSSWYICETGNRSKFLFSIFVFWLNELLTPSFLGLTTAL